MMSALAPDMQRSVDAIANRWPAVGLAAGVIRDGRLDTFAAHGLADIASATPPPSFVGSMGVTFPKGTASA
jgi:hypothetical protein